MAQAFNLTAQLNLRGPNNVGKIVSQIKKQLGTINANVNVTINPATIQTVTQLNSALTTLNTTLATTSANATTTAAAVNSLMQAMNAAANSNINQSLNNASNAVQQLGANANAAAGGGAGGGGGGGVTQLRTEMEEFGRQSALAVRRFAAFSLVTSTVFALTNAFNQAFKAFIDFDKEFVKLQQVTGESAARLQNLAGTITELSTSLGVSSSQLAVVSSTLAQAGLSAKDTERALKALALSSLAPSFDDMNQTVEGSIALMRQFGISADQLGAALGSVNAVSAQFAVESSDIIAAIQRTGGVFASASKGVSEGTQALNEFIAVFTSVRATTRESAETIATGLRTIFTRIQRGSTIEALKEFGVTLTDAEGKFVGAYKAVELLSRGLNGIDPRDLKFSQIIEELGGFRQIGKVIPLIQQFGTAQQALAVAQGGQTSLTEDAIVAQLSLANQFAKVREEFVAMVREIGGTDTFQTLAKGALQLASALIQIADSVKGVLPVLAVITAVRGAGALRQFGRGFVGGMRGGQQNAATGGMIRKYAVGGQVPVALMPGETVVYPDMVNRIGVPKLRELNLADKKMARGGGVGLVPGKGRTDSFKTTLPVGSFVIRTDATRALGGPDGVMRASGYAMGGDVQNFKRGTSKPIQKKRTAEQRDEEGRTRQQFYADMVSKRKRPTVDEEGRTREEFYADMVRYAMGGYVQKLKIGGQAKRKKVDQLDPEEYKDQIAAAKSSFSILNQKAVGAAILQGPKRGDPPNSKISKSSIIASLGKGSPYQKILQSSLAKGSIAVQRESLDPKAYKLFDNAIEEGLVSGLNTATSKLSTAYPELPVPAINAETERRKYLAGVNDAAKGNLFEEILTSMKNKGVYDSNPDPQRPFDFSPSATSTNFGLGKLFPKLSTLSYVDAKASSPSDANMTSKIARQALKDIGILKDRKQKSTAEDLTNIEKQIRQSLSGINQNTGLTLSEIQARIPGAKERQVTAISKELGLDRTNVGGKKNYIRRFFGGPIQKFGIGGQTKPVSRTVGIIDSDSWKGDSPDIAAAMKELGITKPDEYKAYMSNLAAQKRQSNGVRKLRVATAVAAAGKTRIAFGGARGQEADNATLRKTTRTQIRVPSDFDRLGPKDEIVDTTSVVTPRNLGALRAADRIRVISTRSKESQDKVVENRNTRDILGASGQVDPTGTNFGQYDREAKSVSKAPKSSGPMEALLAATEVSGVDPKKIITTDLATGKRISPPKVRTPDKMGVITGNFGPTTPAHLEMAKIGAKTAGIKNENVVAMVANDVPIDPFNRDPEAERTAYLPQKSKTGPSRYGMAQAVFGAQGFSVHAMERGSSPKSMPYAFQTGQDTDTYIVPSDKTQKFEIGGSDKPETSRYPGYDPIRVSRTSGPTEGISATLAREAINSGNMGEMQKFLTKEGIEYLSRTDADGATYLSKLQKRPQLLDSILARIQKNAQEGRGIPGRLSKVQEELSKLPARKTKTTPPEVLAEMDRYRQEREKLTKKLGQRPARMLPRLESRARRANGGEIPIIAQEGEYVVNRKSAQSFGYDNLAEINKYHSGGVVGKVQKFASGGQPKLDTLGATATGLSPRAFQIFEKTLFKVSDLFNGMGARTLKTTQAMDMIAAVSPQLAADIKYNGMVHKRTATAQEAVAVRYATLIQNVQKNNLTQKQLDKITAAYANTIQADTNAKNFSITQTKSLGSKIASAWNKASGVVSQAASSFAATLGKKSSVTTPTSLPVATPQASSATTPAPTPLPANPWATVGGGMGVAASGGGNIVSQNQAQAQAQAISQVQGMAQTQPQRPSMMGRIGQGVKGIMGGQGSMAMGFALPMLASSLTSGEPVSAEQAKSNATLGGVATGAGIGASLAGLPGMLIGAVGGLITGIDAGAKAARQFAINIARNKIEDSGEKLAKTFEEINKQSSATPAQLASLNTALKASINAALESGTQALPKASLSQLLTEVGVAALGGGQTSTKENVDTRAAIFEQKGFMGLIKAMRGGQDVENSMYRDIAPTLARETSKGYAVAASQAKSVFEQQFKQGKSVADIMSSDPAEWKKQSEVLARSNAAIQEQILLIQNLSGVSETEKKARIDSIIATEAEGQVRKQFSEVKIAEDLKKLQKEINNLSFSFNRMLGNMDAAVQSSVANLAKLDESLSLSSASLSGGAKVGGSSSGVQNTLDVLKNPAGYSESQKNTAFSRAASPFGSQAGNIEKVLKAGSGLESTVLGTINKTLSGSKGETQEAITAKIESAIRGQLKDLQLPPSLADKLSKQIGQSVGKLRQDGEDTVDYSQLIESVPELSKTIDVFKNTADQASKAMEFNKQAFDRLSEATNQQIDLTVESNARTRNAQNILAKGSMDLNKALGMNVSLGTRRSAIESPIRSMTGGTTDPSAIGMNYNRLEAQRQQLQTGRNQAAASGDVGAVRAFDNQLAQTNTSLRENIDALKGMADSSELASAALDEIDKAQKRQQAGVGIMEKLVTSTPKELANMNQAFARLDANMKGIAVGGTNPEQRKQSLELFQMISPFLGDQEKGLQANVLQSMLQESGVGISPMLQQVLDGMRNPTADPQQALAIQTYQEATQKQAEANLQLATMNSNLANDISTKTGNAVAAAIQSNNIKFEQKQLDDLISKINIVPTEVVPAVGKADGGLIYKAVGGSIFKPKGTDTVPAMLTPGEFVVNRSATQANLPLLKSINNGYSKGGKVKYLASGGYVTSNILKKDSDIRNESLNTDKDVSNDDLPVYNPELFPTTDSKKFSKLSGFISSTTRSWNYAGIVNGLSSYFDELKKSGGSSNYWAGQDIRSAADVNDYNNKIIANRGPDMSKFPINFMVGSTEEFGYAPEFKLETKRSGFGNRWMLPSISSLKDSGSAKAAGKLEKSITAQTLVPSIPFDSEILNKIISNSVPTIIGSSKLRKGKSGADITKYSEKKLLDINDSSEYGYVGNQLEILDMARSASSIATALAPIDAIKNKLQDKPAPLGSAVLTGLSDVAKLYQQSAGGGFIYDPNAVDPGKYMGGVFVSPKDKASTVIGSNFKGNVLAGAAGAGSGGGSNGVGFSENTMAVGPPTEATIGSKLLNTQMLDILKTKATEYQTAVNTAYSELDAYIKNPDNFNSTSRQTQKVSNISGLLSRIYDGNWPGLYIKLPTDDLNDAWKAKGTNGLAIFKPDLASIWEAKIALALSSPNKDLYKKAKGYKLNGESSLVQMGKQSKEMIDAAGEEPLEDKSFPWIGDIKLAEEFSNNILRLEQEASQKSFVSAFKVDDQPTPEKVTLDKITLDKLGPGFSKDTKAEFGFQYRNIEVPKLSRNTGYAPPQNGEILKGIIVSAGGALDTSVLNPFLGEDITAGKGNIFANSLDEIKQKLIDTYTKYFEGDQAAFTSFSLATLATPQTWMTDLEKLNAYTTEDGLITNPWFPKISADAYKNQLLTSPGSGGQAATIPGATISIGDKLKTAQQLINQIIGPKIGVIRAFGYGLAPLSVPAQIGQYAEGLMSLSKSFGSKIVGQNGSVNPNLADVWGRITAVGETFKFLAKDDLVGLSNKIGLAQSAMKVSDGGAIAGQVLQYADFLKTQGTFLAGVSGQAQQTLGKQVTGDQQIASTSLSGGKSQSISDIFKGASDATVAKDGKIQSKEATPPKTLLDLGKKVFNPYNSFANPNDRASLIDYLMSQIKDQVNPYFKSGVTTLRNYLLGMDTLISGATVNEQDLDVNYKGANSALLALTNGEFGALPNVQKIKELAAFRAAQQQAKKDKAEQQAQNPGQVAAMATGGVVYASNGTLVNYQPRGTDTVPAMLTPGEFVVNRSATQRNLPLLHAINSGGTQGLNRGGIVNYLQSGGIILPQYHAKDPVVGPTNNVVGGGSIKVDGSSAARGLESALTVGTNALKQVLQGFGISPASITAINNFVTGLQKVSEVLANINITPEVKFTGTVDVNVRGTEGLTGPMRDLVNSAIQNAMSGLQIANNGANLQVPGAKDYTGLA